MSDWKLVTLRLSADEEGGYHLPDGSVACFGRKHWLRGGPHIVSVEPAPRLLPTELGSLILARVAHFSSDATKPVLLELVDESCQPGVDSVITWSVVGAGEWIPAGDIRFDWVQIDPATLRPVEEGS